MSEHPYRPSWLSRFYAAIGKAAAALARDARLLTPAWRRTFPRTPIWFALLVVVVFPVWLWLLVEALGDVWTVTAGLPRTGDAAEVAEANRNREQSIFFGIGIIGALLAVIIVPVRLWLQNRQTITAEQGHITDRLNKAIEMLGAEKTVKRREFTPRFLGEELDEPNIDYEDDVPTPALRPDGTPVGAWEYYDETLPNLEVRLGAIYALERIAQDSERDHITVMETLCAYIRENAPADGVRTHDLGPYPEAPDPSDAEAWKAWEETSGERVPKLHAWANDLPPPRVDIQAALTVIGRRGEEQIAHERRQRNGEDARDPGFRLDLRDTNLQAADLRRANLDHALLTGAHLEGADLGRAHLERAFLGWAHLERAFLGEAHLEGADLGRAQLKSADLRDWTIGRTSLRSADFTEAKRLQQAHVNEGYGDGMTVLHAGIVAPDHWPEGDPGWQEYDRLYREWLAAGAPPGRPRGGGEGEG